MCQQPFDIFPQATTLPCCIAAACSHSYLEEIETQPQHVRGVVPHQSGILSRREQRPIAGSAVQGYHHRSVQVRNNIDTSMRTQSSKTNQLATRGRSIVVGSADARTRTRRGAAAQPRPRTHVRCIVVSTFFDTLGVQGQSF